MRSELILTAMGGALCLAVLAMRPAPLEAQANAALALSSDPRAALRRAEAELSAADERATALERQAASASQAATKAASENAALAARIQLAEAGITAAEARLALIQDQQAALDLSLAERREPLMRLTAALQRLARRPLALSALRSGSLSEAVYLRAMLATTLPEVGRRTSGLRSEVEHSRKLADAAARALAGLRQTEKSLGERRAQLAGFEARQRLASRQASAAAQREAERAFALAEDTRDLDSLVGELDRAGRLRNRLAQLPGPIMRPPRPGASQVMGEALPSPSASATAPPPGYRLPVTGQTVAGFGSRLEGGAQSQGLVLAPRGGALVVSPGKGRVVFSGPYKGYGAIVIVEHADGWTSLVTGLARSDVRVGEELVAGAPIGVAPPRAARITLELRRQGVPLNPLDFVG